MKVADAVAVAGPEVHVCRYREARTLGLSGYGGRIGGDAAVPVTALVAAADRAPGDGGVIVLVRARRLGGPATGPERSARR